jgi:hypothetical protein
MTKLGVGSHGLLLLNIYMSGLAQDLLSGSGCEGERHVERGGGWGCGGARDAEGGGGGGHALGGGVGGFGGGRPPLALGLCAQLLGAVLEEVAAALVRTFSLYLS